MAGTSWAGIVPDGLRTVRHDAGHAARTYVCIAAWPGGHDNPHWKRYEEGIVYFLDTDLSALKLSKLKYKSLTDISKSKTKELLSETDDDSRFYRRTAFRIQPAAADSLRNVFVQS